ncbi:MAG: class I SAM-dependent methyltransferase [Chloroflexota bacterium]|nr:class I SAM-dependent methyltransferase [Chloroflexota bacterium]
MRPTLPSWYESTLRYTFDAGAPLYAWATAQAVWRRNSAEMAMVLPDTPQLRVLDLGTGPGISIIGMHDRRPDAWYVGLDIAGKMLEEAQRRMTQQGLPTCLLQADATRIPLGDSTVDAVTGHSFLYLLPEPVPVLQEVRRVLRPGGKAIFMEPCQGPVEWSKLLWNHWRDGRYLLTMMGWSLLSRVEGRYDRARFEREANAAALRPEQAQPLLYGLGLLLSATVPP